MPTAKLTSRCRITIPREVREALALEAGHRVFFQIREGGVVEMHPETVDLMSLCGILKPEAKGVTLEDMAEAIGKGAAQESLPSGNAL